VRGAEQRHVHECSPILGAVYRPSSSPRRRDGAPAVAQAAGKKRSLALVEAVVLGGEYRLLAP
jgi:hypothetical protein